MLALWVADIGTLGKLGHALGVVLALLVVITALTMLSGRLLGLRLRWWRALVAGFPGIVMGYTFSWAVNGYRRPPVFTPQSVWPVAVLGTMVVAVVMELLDRPGRLAGVQARLVGARQLQLPNPVRAVRRRLARARRYLEVTRIAARHGLGPYLGMGRREPPGPRPDLDAGAGVTATAGERPERRRVARRLRRALEEGGGMFVKLGQVLSTRADLLPPEVIAELSGLLDDVAPPPRAEIEALLAAELGAEPTEVFAEFDPEPLAAASIAQVYRARLRSGEPVVVKVQRPGIRELVERDLDILLRLARTLEARAAWARDAHAVELASGFAEALTEELDFRVEARNIAAVAASMVADGRDGDAAVAAVLLPEVHAGLSTDRVLVLGRIDGSNVRDAGPLLERLGADRQRLARELLRALLRQILDGGTFHADPHPANVFVTPDGRLALLDFGSVGRLDPLEQAGLRRMLLAVHRRDATGLTDAILEIVQVRDRADEALLERALAHFMARHLGPGMTPDATMFTALFQLLLDFGLAFPPELGGVFRALVTLEGTLNLLAPGFKIIDETQTLAGEWLLETFQPATLRKAAADELLAVLPILRRLPRRVDRIATAAEAGTFSVNVRLFADQRDVRVVGGLVDRAVLAFLGGILGIMSVLLVTSTIGPGLGPRITVLEFFGYVGLFLSVCLILRVIVAIARDSR